MNCFLEQNTTTQGAKKNESKNGKGLEELP